jgi:hypothetical protein
MHCMVVTKLNDCYEDKQNLRRNETENQFVIGTCSVGAVAEQTKVFSTE